MGVNSVDSGCCEGEGGVCVVCEELVRYRKS